MFFTLYSKNFIVIHRVAKLRQKMVEAIDSWIFSVKIFFQNVFISFESNKDDKTLINAVGDLRQ